MPRLKDVQTNFASGELDERLFGRTDLKQYYQGLALARNIMLLPQGGAKRRDGMEHIGTAQTVGGGTGGALSSSRCISFEFSTTQTYKLVLTDLRLEVYLGKVLQASITTVFAHTDLAQITWTQSLDNLIIFHPDYPSQQLVRGATHTSWTIAAVAWEYIPQYRFTATNTNPAGTIQPAAVTGTQIVTGVGTTFAASMVGQYISGNGGYARIIEFISTTSIRVFILTDFWDTLVIPTGAGGWTLEAGWEDAWSATRGYPVCGTFHQGRFVVGGSRDLPQTLWFSKTSFFFDFDLGSNLADDAIAVTLDTNEVSSITGLYAGRQMQIFTSNSEWYIPNNVSGLGITPNTIEIRRTTSYGSAAGVQNVNADGSTIFLNRAKGAVREFIYNDNEQAYTSVNLSILSSHLIRTPVDMVFRKSTNTEDADYVMLLNSDGTIAVLNTVRSEDIFGWSLIETNGTIKSMAVELDVIFCVVERTINGVAHNFIEYFDPLHSTDGSTYITTGLPTDTFTGLTHLEGETVNVIADGNILQSVTVSGGTAVIERDATSYVEFGLPYVQTGDTSGDGYKLKTVPIDAQMPDGTIVGKKKRLVEVTMQLTNTKSMKVNGNRVYFRQLGSGLLDQDTVAYNGYKVVEGILGYGDKAQIDIGDDVTLPVTVNSLAYKVAV